MRGFGCNFTAFDMKVVICILENGVSTDCYYCDGDFSGVFMYGCFSMDMFNVVLVICGFFLIDYYCSK